MVGRAGIVHYCALVRSSWEKGSRMRVWRVTDQRPESLILQAAIFPSPEHGVDPSLLCK
jgi:hypothetical protein